MSPWRRLLAYLRPYWPILAVVVLLTLLVTLTTLALPWIIGKDLIDSVILGEKSLKLLNLIVLGTDRTGCFEGIILFWPDLSNITG